MDYHIINSRCVTVLIHKDEKITARLAAGLVRRALETCGYAPWEHTLIEVFSGGSGAMLVATPEKDAPCVSAAPWAPDFIKEYFTD